MCCVRTTFEFEEVERLEDALPKLDVLYMTRVQKERFFNEEDYVRMKDFYILDKKKMELAPQDMIVMHPLPRVNEISVEVDDDPRAAYFKQVQYGCLCTYGSDSYTSGGESMLNVGQLNEGFGSRPYRSRQEHVHLPLSETGSAGLLCCHHQKCPQQQNGQKRYHQSRMSG